MFVETDFEVSSNMFAIVQGSMKENLTSYRVSPATTKVYHCNAYWFSEKRNTKDALSFGYMEFTFDDLAAGGDNLITYGGLSELDVLLCADSKSKDNMKTFRKSASALFGNKTVYSSGFMDDADYRVLVESWFNLPNAPAGTHGWMKRVRN